MAITKSVYGVMNGKDVHAFIIKNSQGASAQIIEKGATLDKLFIKDKNGDFIPKIKLSENSEKVTNPGNKKIYRVYEKESGKIKADLICLNDETFDEAADLLLFDPLEPWKKTKLKGGTYTLRPIMKQIFCKGECVYTSPKVMEIREYCKQEMETLWDETKRFVNPHKVYVDLSPRLYDIKIDLLDQMSEK